MTPKSITGLTLALGLAISSSPAFAGTPETAGNPIFGKASAQDLTVSENKAVLGKGDKANTQGWWGNYYARQALHWGERGYNSKKWEYYSSASKFASTASDYYSRASFYQKNRQ